MGWGIISPNNDFTWSLKRKTVPHYLIKLSYVLEGPMSRWGRLSNQKPKRLKDRGKNRAHTLLKRVTIAHNSHCRFCRQQGPLGPLVTQESLGKWSVHLSLAPGLKEHEEEFHAPFFRCLRNPHLATHLGGRHSWGCTLLTEMWGNGQHSLISRSLSGHSSGKKDVLSSQHSLEVWIIGSASSPRSTETPCRAPGYSESC